MWRHHLLTLWRALARRRLYGAINVLGLAVGIAVFLALAQVVRFESGFERWIPGVSRIYAIRSDVLRQGLVNATMGDLLPELQGEQPGLVGARLRYRGGVVRARAAGAGTGVGAEVAPETVAEVDPGFLQVFDLPLARGDRATVLQAPDAAVISQAKARRYFGAADPVGRPLAVDFGGASHVYRVAGVMRDLPPATEFSLDILVPLKAPTPQADPDWRRLGRMSVQTYVRLDRPEQARALDAELDRFVDRRPGAEVPKPVHESVRLRTLPLTDLHLSVPPGRAVVAALGVVGLLSLGLAAVNYVNLATAQAGTRAREVAIRKVMGAAHAALVLQFLGESTAMAAMGALGGAALCELVLPAIGAGLGVPLRLDYLHDPGLWGVLVAVVLAVGIGAGAYPALVLARFQPAAVLASARSPGGGRAGGRLREALVAVQFAVAIGFIVCTAVIASQSLYLHRMDLGFRREGLVVVDSFARDGLTDAQHLDLLAAWRALPGVVAVTESDAVPGAPDMVVAQVRRLGAHGGVEQGQVISLLAAGPDFFAAYGARLAAGRWPSPDHGGDFLDPPRPYPPGAPRPPLRFNAVLNETAARRLGFGAPRDALGARLSAPHDVEMQVVGVVKDIRFGPPREPIPPILYRGLRDPVPQSAAAVRYAGADPHALIERMGEAWRRIAPAVPFEARPAEAELQAYYRSDDLVGRLMSAAAGLAVLVGCVGLYGLAAFAAERRVKEIGIRKTLGASAGDIVRLLLGQFLRPVLLANLAAWPLAFWAMRAYLAGFDRRIGLSPLYFLAASALALAVAAGAVVGQAWTVARAEPARALRQG